MANMARRTFLEAAAVFPIALGQSSTPQRSDRVVHVEHGADRFNQQRAIAGANQITYKVSGQDTKGGLFLFEQASLRKGGPPRHLHHGQEEWFYVMEGEYVFEVGQERMRLRPGDSLLAPRTVPHVWAYVGETPGKILIGFQPAGKMETFFQEAAKIPDFAADEKLYRACEMEIVGPPLSLVRL
jgi:mannose-6-phosphate isomerase-like protein (cupin superfamily)